MTQTKKQIKRAAEATECEGENIYYSNIKGHPGYRAALYFRG
jgi:hypothetical protein